jgi:nucleoside-diphosphate-sugar epimerase
LVTGSSGLLGRHLTKALVARGDFVEGWDVKDGIDCLHMFRNNTHRYDLAIHCAAIVGGRQSIENAPIMIATNLALDAWFFRWLELSGTPRAVYYSSSAAYPTWLQQHWPDLGRSVARRLSEIDINFQDLSGSPDQTYGWVKLTGEVLASYSTSRVTVLRPFSGYASDQDLTYPFPSFIRRAKRRMDPFEVWGDGEQVRDWIHVDDIVGATLVAVEQEIDGPTNLCSGTSTSFNQLARFVAQQVGYSPVIEHKLDAPTGVFHRVGNPSKMLSFYQPTISLAQGITEALEAT